MTIIQIGLLAFGALLAVGLVYMALAGPNSAKASQRRLDQLRYRHSESTDTKVELQLKESHRGTQA